jgi:HK97 family phage major capsid protein
MPGDNYLSLAGSGVPLPQDYADTILQKAFENSLVGRLTPSRPIPLGTTVIPVYEGGIEAGPVAEGGTKPVGSPSMSHKTLAPQKFACIVIVSEEMAQADPLGMLTLVEQDITSSIGRAIDLAIFHGRSAISGTVQAGWTFVNQTTVRQEIPAAADGTELGDTLLAGATALGSADPGYDLSGFAFDPRFRFQLIGARDAFDRPVFQQSMNLSSGIDNVFGIPAAYGRAVPGLIGASADTGVKGIGGDWSKLVWGYAKQLTIKRSTEAVIPDGADLHYLFAENKMALLVEAIVGWTVLDADAFVAYDAEVVAP